MTYRIEGLNLKYGNLVVYENFDMSVRDKTIVSILGPSGCGKTTLLNFMSGIEKPQGIKVNDFETLTKSYIFQEPRLLPWKTVYENIAFVIRERFEKEQVRILVDEQLDRVGLSRFKDYFPGALSGGMKQRVAIARAFVYPSEMLIMDEPFQGLDIRTKDAVMAAFLKSWEKDRRTVVFVTHDVEEAVRLGDEIHILEGPPVRMIEEVRTEGVFRNVDDDNGNFRDLCSELKNLLSKTL